jgi:hypothetical protein
VQSLPQKLRGFYSTNRKVVGKIRDKFGGRFSSLMCIVEKSPQSIYISSQEQTEKLKGAVPIPKAMGVEMKGQCLMPALGALPTEALPCLLLLARTVLNDSPYSFFISLLVFSAMFTAADGKT